MSSPTSRAFAVLCVLASACAVTRAAPAAGRASQPIITGVTLYTEGPAQVEATLDLAGARSVEFSLPRHLVPESLETLVGDRPVSSSLTRVLVKQGKEQVFKHYSARLGNLPAGAKSVRIRYLTRGLGWSPAYGVDIQDGGAVFVYEVVMRSEGDAVPSTKVTLVSGSVEGLGESDAGAPGRGSRYLYSLILSRLGRHIPAPSGPGNIHVARRLEGQGIAAGATVRLPVVKARLPLKRTYVWDASWIEYVDPAYSKRAHAVLTLSNDTQVSFAEGTVRVSEKGIYVGDAFMGWTEPGSQSMIVMSGVKDLTVEKTETTADRLETYERVHTVTFKVAHTGPSEVAVQIVDEPAEVGRGYGRRKDVVYQFSDTPETTDDGAFRWTVQVAAGSQRVISYQYSEPVDVSQFLVLQFACDDSPRERKYLFQDAGSTLWSRSQARMWDRHAYGIYRLELPADLKRADLELDLSNNFLVSLAPETDGGPGAFQVVASALTLFRQDVRNWSNAGHYDFDLSPYLAKGPQHVVYVKLEDGTKSNDGGPALRSVAVYRVPEGWPSRARDYTKPTPEHATFGTLQNPGFEEVVGNVAAGWQPRDSGYVIDSTEAHSGRYSVRFSNPDNDAGYRAYMLQAVELAQDAPRPVRVSGWTKAKDVPGKVDKEYSLWVDAAFMSDTPWWGAAHLGCSVGTHDWEYREVVLVPPEPLNCVYVHAVFRGHGGAAWFDDFSVHEYRDWKPGDPVPKREHFLYGELPCDQPLAKQDTPYYVVANVVIPEGKTLTIEPGAEIVFDSDYSIAVGGDIRAIGSEAQPIRFTAAQVPSPTGFRPAKAAIRFALVGGAPAGKNSVFEHCVFKDVAAPAK